MASEKKIDQVILGLLSHEPMTGYDIKKRMDSTLKLFWNASYGSIYPTLNLLEREKKVIKSSSSDNGRDRFLYTITEEGRSSLKRWLQKPVIKDELRYETLLKLFFGNEVGSEITINHIQDFEDKIKMELPVLSASVQKLKELDDEPAHRYFMLTAMFGEKVYEAYIEWCEIAKDCLLEKKAK